MDVIFCCLLEFIECDIFLSISGCKTTANIMYAGTVSLGCGAFQSAQEKACLCEPKGSGKAKKRNNEL